MNGAKTQRPKSVCLARTETVRMAMAGLLGAGCEVTDGSVKDGHLTVKDGDQVVYRALQKGKGQPWIVSCYDGGRVTWGQQS